MAKTANSTLTSASQQGPVTAAIAAMREPEPTPPRRGFLRGLLTLPLIGGGVTLIGAPSAVATPVTGALLDSYDAWLFYERRYLRFERYGAQADRSEWGLGCDKRFVVMDTLTGKKFDYVSTDNPGGEYHVTPDPRMAPQPSTRAALVLSAVGADWRA